MGANTSLCTVIFIKLNLKFLLILYISIVNVKINIALLVPFLVLYGIIKKLWNKHTTSQRYQIYPLHPNLQIVQYYLTGTIIQRGCTSICVKNLDSSVLPVLTCMYIRNKRTTTDNLRVSMLEVDKQFFLPSLKNMFSEKIINTYEVPVYMSIHVYKNLSYMCHCKNNSK